MREGRGTDQCAEIALAQLHDSCEPRLRRGVWGGAEVVDRIEDGCFVLSVPLDEPERGRKIRMGADGEVLTMFVNSKADITRSVFVPSVADREREGERD